MSAESNPTTPRFNALEQAQRDASPVDSTVDPEVKRYHDWVGAEGEVDQKTAADMAEYLKKRPQLTDEQHDEFNRARNNVKKKKKEGVLVQDPKRPGFYSYKTLKEEQDTVDRYNRGVSSSVSVPDLVEEQRDKNHLTKPEDDYQNLDTMSLSELAKQLADAEARGHKKVAKMVEDALEEKLVKEVNSKHLNNEQADKLFDRVFTIKDRELEKLLAKVAPSTTGQPSEPNANPGEPEPGSMSEEPVVAGTDSADMAKSPEPSPLVGELNAEGERFGRNIGKFSEYQQAIVRDKLKERIAAEKAKLGDDADPLQAAINVFKELSTQLEAQPQSEVSQEPLLDKGDVAGNLERYFEALERFDDNLRDLPEARQDELRDQLSARTAALRRDSGDDPRSYEPTLAALDEINAQLEQAANERAQAADPWVVADLGASRDDPWARPSEPEADSQPKGSLEDIFTRINAEHGRIIYDPESAIKGHELKVSHAIEAIIGGQDPEAVASALIDSSEEFIDVWALHLIEVSPDIDFESLNKSQKNGLFEAFKNSLKDDIRQRLGLNREHDEPANPPAKFVDHDASEKAPADDEEAQADDPSGSTGEPEDETPEQGEEVSDSEEVATNDKKMSRTEKLRAKLHKKTWDRNIDYLQSSYDMTPEDAAVLAKAEEEVFNNPGKDIYQLRAQAEFEEEAEARKLMRGFRKSIDTLRSEVADINGAAISEEEKQSRLELNGRKERLVRDQYHSRFEDLVEKRYITAIPDEGELTERELEWQGPERYQRGSRRLRKIGQRVLGGIPLLRRNLAPTPQQIPFSQEYQDQLDKVNKLKINDYLENPEYQAEQQRLDEMWERLVSEYEYEQEQRRIRAAEAAAAAAEAARAVADDDDDVDEKKPAAPVS